MEYAAHKMNIGGFVFREVLTDLPNDEIAIGVDMDAAWKWYQTHVGLDEDAFQRSVETTRQEIIKDLRSPKFRQLAWEIAREFEHEIFSTAAPQELKRFQASALVLVAQSRHNRRRKSESHAPK